MAAVIAHEVRNLLAAVRGALQVIGSRLPPNANAGAIVTEIIARLDGLNDLIQDLLVFARPPAPKPLPTDLRPLATAVDALLKRDPAFRDLDVAIDGEVPPALVDGNLLTIAFQNLLINAAQSQGHGTVQH